MDGRRGERRLRHRVLQAEFGKRFEAHETGVLAAQCNRLGDDLTVVSVSLMGATANPGVERLLAQITTAGKCQKALDA